MKPNALKIVHIISGGNHLIVKGFKK